MDATDLPQKRAAWFTLLDERQQKEVQFAEVYAQHFSHGTDGHNRLLLVAKMAEALDGIYDSVLDARKE
jgi:hypothetical protein